MVVDWLRTGGEGEGDGGRELVVVDWSRTGGEGEGEGGREREREIGRSGEGGGKD